jgi:hypothetical protein
VSVVEQPVVHTISPAILFNVSSTPLQAQRVQLNVSNPLFFTAIKAHAAIQGSLFEIITDGTGTYFDFETGMTSSHIGPNLKAEQLPLTLRLALDAEGGQITPTVTSGQSFTVYKSTALDLVSLSHSILTSKYSQDIVVEAKYFIEGQNQELMLVRV